MEKTDYDPGVLGKFGSLMDASTIRPAKSFNNCSIATKTAKPGRKKV